MTIKEIAELCGVERTTVLRWARKVPDNPVQNAQGLALKLELFRLYPDYESHVANPLPKEALAANALLLYPQIKFKGDVFYGCHFDY